MKCRSGAAVRDGRACKGSRGDKVFVRDSEGKVQRLIDRRDNNDLAWHRVM